MCYNNSVEKRGKPIKYNLKSETPRKDDMKMDNEYGNDFITLTDEEGNEVELEHLDTMEYNGETYMAFIPAYEGTDEMLDDSAELIVLKVDNSAKEEMLVTVDDEDLLQKVFDLFVERLEERDEEEADFSDDEEQK